MRTYIRILFALVIGPIAILAATLSPSLAADIDIYGSPTNSLTNPNILIIIDNSSNWAANNQGWADGKKQGESELSSLRALAAELADDVNVSLMLLAGETIDGGYIRYHMRTMNDLNKAAFRELIGNIGTCVNGPNSLNGTPNCLYDNFQASNEKISVAQVDYSATLFEAFKYFGGYTNPANADTNLAGSPILASRYGPLRYSSLPDLLSKIDRFAFTDSATVTTTSSNRLEYNLSVSSCAKNYIILIGNGMPNNDSPASLLSGVGGDTSQIKLGTVVASASNADEWARFLNRTDVSAAAGQQNVTTFTIDVYKNAQDLAQTQLFKSMALNGGGKYFQASNEAAILDALRKIMSEIQSVNSVFASSGLPVSVNTQGTYLNQIFIGMFRPNGSGEPRWYGNLKQYQFALDGTSLMLADANLKDAINPATGFITPCAESFWSSDTGNYWDFPGSKAKGNCTAATSNFPAAGSSSRYSDLPDGDVVEKGGAAQRLRGVESSGGTLTSSSTYYATRPLKTCVGDCTALTDFNDANGNITQQMLGVTTSLDRTDLIDWVRGKDTKDENANNLLTEMRPSAHGDVVHSQPGVVDYGSTYGVVTFYGSNEGIFHAINGQKTGADGGKDIWGFVAPETYGRLKRLRDNSPYVNLPGVSPRLIPTPIPKDYFFDGSVTVYQNSATVWIFPTMRRGGRAVYAFDVSTPTATDIVPKWRKGCFTDSTTDDRSCSTGWATIGQTWSKPKIGKLSGYNKPVLVFGGGYDTCEDTDSQTRCTSTPRKGANIWFVDADTGAIIRTYPTNYSVPGDVTLIKDANGNITHLYAGDTGGYVYRVNVGSFDGTTLGSDWTSNSLASNITIAYLSDDNNARKFLNGPDVVKTANYNEVLIGSGDRERPLISNYPCVDPVTNAFYMIKDSPPGYPAVIKPADLADVSSTCPITSSKGWYFNMPNTCEQVVNKATSIGGYTYFGTNQPVNNTSCATNLGIARGYAVSISGGCAPPGAGRSITFTGGGLPPSPVAGIVDINGKKVTFCLGCGTDATSRTGGSGLAGNASSLGGSKIKIAPTGKQRTFWYKK